MIEFDYDFMDMYWDQSDFQYIKMDMDSSYMAIIASNMRSIKKPSMLNKYEKGLKGFCHVDEGESDSVYDWFPRECCNIHKILDKHTPCLFKVEFEGEMKWNDGVLGLFCAHCLG